MINIIWFLFIFIGITFGILTNNISNINDVIIKSSKESLDIFVNIIPNMILWLGILNIAKESGLINKFSKLIHPILKPLFKEIPNDDVAIGYISTNIISNVLGLSNVSTPFGIKAIQRLQELNNKETISKSMKTFLIINICGLTIIPTTIISLREMYKSINPSIIILPTIIVSFMTFIIVIIILRFSNE